MIKFVTREEIDKIENLLILDAVRVKGVPKKKGEIIKLGGQDKLQLVYDNRAKVITDAEAEKLTADAKKAQKA